jgi:hypothetical protein
LAISTDKRQVFLFQAHEFSEELVQLFEELERSVAPLGEARLLFHGAEPRLSGPEWRGRVLQVDNRGLAGLGYRTLQGKLFPGHTHFLLLWFFRQFPAYLYYWVVEYDVRYGGDWSDFFACFDGNNRDFLTTNVHTYHQMPLWAWWAMDGPGVVPPVHARLRSFNPLFRLSRPALHFIHQALVEGWVGHNEVLLPRSRPPARNLSRVTRSQMKPAVRLVEWTSVQFLYSYIINVQHYLLNKRYLVRTRLECFISPRMGHFFYLNIN